jgi:hypothetical protein
VQVGAQVGGVGDEDQRIRRRISALAADRFDGDVVPA